MRGFLLNLKTFAATVFHAKAGVQFLDGPGQREALIEIHTPRRRSQT